jgi:hypothetical protein
LAHCKSLLAKIRNGNDTEKNQSILKLKGYITPGVVDAIAKAAIEIKQYVKKFEIAYIRSENETKLLKVLEDLDIKISNFSRDAILILAQEEILEMIEDELIDPNDLIGLPLKALEALFYSDEIIEMLKDGSVDLKDLLNLYRITTQKYKQDFSEVLQEFQTAVENGEYPVSDILERYEDHHLHLEFMSGDPTDIVLENSDNEEIVKFGIKNYDVDIEWIREELRGDRDWDSTALIDFDVAIGTYEEDYDSDSLIGEDSQLEDVY